MPHTDKYYAAKCLKAEKRDEGVWFYLVHYQGWNKSFDEWIEQQGLVPFDAELAKVSLGQDEPAKEKPKRAEKKRKAPELAPWDEQQQDVQVLLAPLLQKVLLDDKDTIEGGQLHALPSRPTVADLLKGWLRPAEGESPEDLRPRERVAAGLRIYFDKALQQHLLYPEEQAQAEQELRHGSVASCIYGPVHLLRLLCQLPVLMPMAQVKADERAMIEAQLARLSEHLKQNYDALFPNHDVPAIGQPLSAPVSTHG